MIGSYFYNRNNPTGFGFICSRLFHGSVECCSQIKIRHPLVYLLFTNSYGNGRSEMSRTEATPNSVHGDSDKRKPSKKPNRQQ